MTRILSHNNPEILEFMSCVRQFVCVCLYMSQDVWG